MKLVNLQDLKPVTVIQPLKLIVYGGPGIGKSTFAADAPNPLFVDIENGADTLAVAKIPISSSTQFYDLVEDLCKQEHEFKTLVVDTIDWFEKLVKQNIIKTFNNSHGTNVQSIGEMSGAGGIGYGYVMMEREMQRFTGALDYLRKHAKMNIILLAHEATDGKTVNDLVYGQYTKVDMKMEKKSIAHLSEWADMILYATRNIRLNTEGPRKAGAKTKAEYFERIFYTNDSGRFRAKNRLGLPEKLELNYKILSDAIKQAYKDINSRAKVSQRTASEKDLKDIPIPTDSFSPADSVVVN